jgi:hypothetical protein
MTNQDQCTHSPLATPGGADLSKTIDASIERQPGEQVRSVRVFGDLYRCNWRTARTSDWIGVTTGRIIRSKMLRVVLADNQLVIDEVG